MVAGFKAELEEAAGHGHVGVGQVVLHADHVGPHAGDDLAHAGQLAGLILQGNHQIGLAAAHDHAAGDHAGKDVYIDIAAGDQADGLFALDGQLAEQRGGNRRGTGTFGHQLLVFHQGQDGGSNLILADCHDVVHILFDHLKGGFAGGLYRNAVRKGIHMVQRFIRMVAVRIVHAGGTGSLNAVNLDIGAQALDGKGHTGQQTAAAHGHHNSFHIGQLIQNFQANGTLTGNDQLIIIGVDEGHACFFLQFHSAVMGVIVSALDQLHLGAQAFGAFHLHQRRAVRHADNALDAHAGGGQCHALCMVARRAGDHAFGALLCGQLADFVISATHLKAAGHLQVLGFQVQVTRAVQPRCRNQIRAACNVTQNKRGMVDLIQCKH